MENSRRQSLRSRASLNSLEREAQLEKKPKTQPKSLQPRIDALQSFPLRRSMSKKVEEFLQWLQTPRQPARHSNRVPTPLSALKIQEVSSEKSPRGSPVSVTQDSPAIDWKDFTRKRLFQGEGNYGGNSKPKELEQLSKVQPGETVITESEEMKVTEKRTLRKSQPDRKSPKTPQSRDRFGRWLPKVLSGKGPPGKDQRDRNPKGEQDGNVKCKANKERSSVKQTEEPGTELKKVKEQQNCIQRRSLRLANLYSSKEKACSLDHIEQCHLECNDINTEESMNTGCEPDVADSSETQQVPDHRSSVEEGLETTKVVQAIMKEANEESEILERLPCDTSSLSEPACLSVKDTCGSLAQSNSDSVQKQDFGIMTPRADLVDKEVQTVTPEPFILAAEELKTEDLKMQAEMFVEDPSPEESQSDVVKESPPFKQALQNLRNGMEFGKAMPGRQEEQAGRRDAERSEALPGPESHEGSKTCSESLPLSPEGGQVSGELMGIGGEVEPVLPPKVAAHRRGISEPFGETLNETAEHPKCAVECAGELKTAFPDVEPGNKPNSCTPAGKEEFLAFSNKLTSESVQAVLTNPSGSQASGIEVARLNLPGSTISETVAKGAELVGPSVAEPDPGGGDLPGSFISEPGPEQTNLPESTVSDPDAGGATLSGSFMSETEALQTDILGSSVWEGNGGINLPGSSISESMGGTNCAGSSVLESTEWAKLLGSSIMNTNGGTNLPGSSASERSGRPVSKSEFAPSLKQQLPYEQGMADTEDRCTFLQEPESQNVAASPTTIEHHLEDQAESLPLPLGMLHGRDSKADFKPVEKHTIRKEISETLKTSKSSLVLQPADLLRLANSGPAVSDGVAAGEPPTDSAPLVQAENLDENAVLPLEGAVLPEEQVIQAGGELASSMCSASRDGLGDLVTWKRSRRRRRRRRRRKRGQKTDSSVQAGNGVRSSDVLANIAVLDKGQQAEEIAVPVPPTDAQQPSAVGGVKELCGEGSCSNRIDYTKPETVKIMVDCNQTGRALKIEEETSAEGQIMGERTRWEVTRRKPESDEAKISEASEKVRGANGQAEAVAANLHQDAEAQYVEKNKETPKSALQLIVSNLDSSKNFADLQIAIITFFKERKLLITSIGVKKSRKRGFVTFQSGKDTSRALKYNGEDLLGHALRIRRPPQIPKPVAIVKGRKRKLKDADGEASILCPAKKSNIQKTTALTKKNKQEPVSLIKRRKKKRKQISSSEAASTEPSGEVVEGTTEASLRQLKKRKRRISTAALSAESKGDKLEDKLLTKEKKKSTAKAAFCEGTEGNAASLPQKKKKKKSQQQEVFLSDKQAEGEKEEEEKVASVLQKKKKKSNEKLALSEKPMVEEHAACAEKTKRKKTQEKTSWCLYIQKLRSQNTPYELKTAIGDFLSERSVPFKEIQLDPDSCSARVELNREGDLNEAVRLDTCKILGQTAKLSKVEKLGALDGRIDTRTLHVKTLPSEVCAKDLKRLFERVAGVWICQNVDKRFAFVVFETEEDSANALSSGEIECRGNLLRLQRACLTKQKKRKILMVKNLPYPISKKYLKSIFNDAEDVHMSKGSQSQGTAYVEYKTAKQAKTALKDFRSRGVPGQAVRVSLIEEGQESPGCQSDGSDSTRSLFIWGLSNQTTVETLKSTFKEAVDARIPRKTGKRFAFVDFKTAEAARRARAEFQDVEIDGRQIKLYFTNSTQ